jgi:hypothetical protein
VNPSETRARHAHVPIAVHPPAQQRETPIELVQSIPPAQTQVPVLHVAPAGQTRAHRPQLFSSVRMFAQAVPQTISPMGHTHPTRVQLCPVTQRVPHARQFVVVSSVASQPSAGIRLQSPWLGEHAPIAQLPPAHAGVALGSVHTRPHEPQELTVRRSDSHPLPTFASQSAKFALQRNVHAPAAHAATALGRDGHAMPHAPQ